MNDQLTDRARKAAEEIRYDKDHCTALIDIDCRECMCAACRPSIDDIAAIIDRHWRKWLSEKNRDAEKSRQFNESEIRRFEKNHKYMPYRKRRS